MKIIFTGDFSASGVFAESILSGDSIFDPTILSIFNNSDYVHINLENPITDANFQIKKGVGLNAPPILGEYLKKNGISICNLANNHIMDCGLQGLKDTISILSKTGIIYYGISGKCEYTILKKGNLKVILLSSCTKYEHPWDNGSIRPTNININQIKEIAARIKKVETPDIIIFNYHGGTEFNIIPEPRRRIFFHKLIQECHIDIVIGHHAHVPQGMEWIDNKLIIYGLGNLCFDLKYHHNVTCTNVSYFVECNLSKNCPIIMKTYIFNIDYDQKKLFLNVDNTYKEKFFQKLNVFDNEDKYREAWEKDCFNLYFLNRRTKSNLLVGSYHLTENSSKNKIKIIVKKIKKMGLLPQIKFFGQFYYDFKSSCTRPLFLGMLTYLLRGDLKNEK